MTTNVAIACQGGGSHTAFTGGVLETVLPYIDAREDCRLVGLSGTSGGAVSALAGWYGYLVGGGERAAETLRDLWADIATAGPYERLLNDWVVWGSRLQHISPIEEFPTEKFDLMHDVMLRGPFLVAKHAIPHIRETDDGVGAIGNMASIHGHIATQDKVAYISAKFGLRGLTQCIAAEGGGDLRGFSVSTGYVKTPLVTNQIPDTAEERGISEQEVVEDVMLGESRVKEMMEPVDVANLFTFGFSKRGRHLNGGDLTWDGGHLYTY